MTGGWIVIDFILHKELYQLISVVKEMSLEEQGKNCRI